MIPNRNTIRAGTCNQHTRDKRKSTRHVVKRTLSFLFMFADMSAMKIRKTTEKKTKLTTGSSDNELSGHWSTTAPPYCAQRPHRQFLLPLRMTCFFPDTVYSFRTRQSHSLHPIDLFKESSGHKGDTWGVEKNMVTNSTFVMWQMFSLEENIKGENSYLSTLTKIMLVLF